MSADTLRHIFEPFFTTRSGHGGTGLGLSVVHGIMKSHRGAVTVKSELGHGTRFELLFPAASSITAAPTGASPPLTADARTRRRILFVDNDEALVFLARRAFSRLGHHIAAFTSPREALREYERHPGDFDVVVTDIEMPDLDGPALVRALRRISKDVKIVMMSGCIRPENVTTARELGVDQLFEKPQSLDELAKLVVPLLA
jgi:CheY-like chemotaxis protein